MLKLKLNKKIPLKIKLTTFLPKIVPGFFQEKTITPLRVKQIITADKNYDALSQITIEAVTNEIDSNIIAENIKENISILGVTGTIKDKVLGIKEINENGIYNASDDGIDGYSSVSVNVIGKYNAKVDAETPVGRNEKIYEKLTEIPATNTANQTHLSGYYSGLENVVNFPLIDTSNCIDFSSFYLNCSSATTFPALNTSKGTTFGSMYSNCSSGISFPSIDTSLGTTFSSMYSACEGCEIFPSLDVSNGTNLASMYQGCISMKHFPNLTVTNKANNTYYMFYGCSELLEADMSNWDLSSLINSTTTYNYGARMFLSCSKLKKIILPSNMVAISPFLAYNCTSLTEFVCLAETPPAMPNVNSLQKTPIESGTGYIYVPDVSVDAYKTASNWSTYADQIKGISELPV